MKLTNNLSQKDAILECVEINGDLYDFMGKINVKAIFQNNSKLTAELIYYFTLDVNSKIINLKVQIKDRTLIGVVREKNVAKKTYETAVINGQTSSLVEKDVNGNYKLSIGCVDPNDIITIEYSYKTEILTEKGLFRYVFPTNIGERYAPYTPNKSNNFTNYTRLSEKVNDADYKFKFNLNWKSKSIFKEIKSMNNIPTNIIKKSDFEYEISSTVCPKNGDFVIVAKTDLENNFYVCQDNEKIYSMLISQVPDIDEDITPKEFVFFVDRSGSMSGERIKSAKEALKLFLNSLNSDSKINIISFSNDFISVFTKPEIFNEKNKEKCMLFIDSLYAGGGTELLNCVKDCLTNKIDEKKLFFKNDIDIKLDSNGIVTIPNHESANNKKTNSETEENTENDDKMERVYFLLTDGEVSNTREIINMIEHYSRNTRFFTIGIGREVSRELIEGIADVSNGLHRVVIDSNGIDEIVIDMLTNVYKTQYKNVTVSFNGKVINYEKRLYPGKFMKIFDISDVGIIGDNKNLKILITGTDCTLNTTKTWELNITKNDFLSSDLIKLFCVSNLIDNKNKSLTDDQIVDLCVKYNIMNDLASFIVVDQVVNKNKEQNNNEILKLIVPRSNRRSDECERVDTGGQEVFRATAYYSNAGNYTTTKSKSKSFEKEKMNKSIQKKEQLFGSALSSTSMGYDFDITDSFGSAVSTMKSNLNKTFNDFGSMFKLTSKTQEKSNNSDSDSNNDSNSDSNSDQRNDIKIDKKNMLNNNIFNYLKTDGHFEYSNESYSNLSNKFDNKLFNEYSANNNLSKELLFNILVLLLLEDINMSKHVMIIRNLKSWILKNGNINEGEFKKQIENIHDLFLSNKTIVQI